MIYDVMDTVEVILRLFRYPDLHNHEFEVHYPRVPKRQFIIGLQDKDNEVILRS
jgi:hypothetical protein